MIQDLIFVSDMLYLERLTISGIIDTNRGTEGLSGKFKKPMTLALYGFYGMQCSECNKIVRVKTKRANERK
ncbi:MAG: hypothetical protein WBQ25_12355 [Nitrososphaeraceae archaeon]